jgi:nitrite reductase/ring-hydroxylating ferredoxin subunit
MLSAADNEVLVRTNAGTAMGEYFRRFWQPVALSRELPESDCPPIRVKVMGEELIAFRDTKGRVGLIEPRCAHRGSELFFGRNEECGIRCVYHGWKYDVDGKCVEMPNVPAGSAYHGKISIKAYPTREFGDLIWAYLGPRERMPEKPPELEFAMVPPAHRYVTKRLQECNWAHSIEGALDTAHFSFLHMPAPCVKADTNPDAAADERRLRWLRNDPMPQFGVAEHEVGFVVGGSRNAEDEGYYWRLTQFMLPAHSVTPSALPGETYYAYTWVPISDEACWVYTYAWHPDRLLTQEERSKYEQGGYGQFAVLGPGYLPVRNRGNDFLIDREEQKHLSFTGVRGIAEQDAMAQASQGVIADRTREHLTPTDIGVVRFRRLVLEEAKALAAGQEPRAPHLYGSYRLRAGGAVTQAASLAEAMRERFGDALGKVGA